MAIIKQAPYINNNSGGGGSASDTLTRFTKTIKSIKELLAFAKAASKKKYQNERFIFDYAIWRGDGSLDTTPSKLADNQLVFTGYGNHAIDTAAEMTTFTGQHSNKDGKITGWVTITITHPLGSESSTGGRVLMQVPWFLLAETPPYYTVPRAYHWDSTDKNDLTALNNALATEPMTISYYADTAIK